MKREFKINGRIWHALGMIVVPIIGALTILGLVYLTRGWIAVAFLVVVVFMVIYGVVRDCVWPWLKGFW